MINQLTNSLQKDLNILKYGNEDSVQFEGRLLYSAFAAWCRKMMSDLSFSDVREPSCLCGVEKSHVIFRLSQVIDSFFNVYSYGRLYFQTKASEEIDSGETAKRLIEDLLFSFECSKLLENNRICNTPETLLIYDKNVNLLLGGDKYKSSNKHSFIGCSKWLKTQENNDSAKEVYDFFGIPNDSISYLKDLCDNADWNSTVIDSTFQLLKINFDDNKNISNSWHTFKEKNVIAPISVIRNENRYYLLKSDNRKLKTAELNTWYRDEREIYRIIYAIRNKYYKPYTVKANKYSQYVILSLNTVLPNSETRILLHSSWGYNHAFDRYKRIIPLFLWDEISKMLEKLGIEIIYS